MANVVVPTADDGPRTGMFLTPVRGPRPVGLAELMVAITWLALKAMHPPRPRGHNHNLFGL